MGGELARGAHHAPARVSSRSTEIEIANGGAILRPTGNGSEEEELIQCQFAVEDIPFRDADFILDILRRTNFSVQNRSSKSGL